MGSGLPMVGLGLLLLLLGADSLQRGAAGLLQRFGLGAEATGVFLLAGVFWWPQLAITAQALAAGDPGLAGAGAVGAGVANLGLLLGLSALVAPLATGLRATPALRIFVLVAAGLALLLGRDGALVAWEGAVLVLAFAVALAFVQRRTREEPTEVRAELARAAVTSQGLVQNLVRLGFAGALVFFGARFLVLNAGAASADLGLESSRGAMLLLGIGAALPAIGMTLMSAVNGLGRFVFGQVLVASLANLLFGLGLVAIVATAPMPSAVLAFGLPAAMALALLLVALPGAALGRREGGLLLLAFVGWGLALAYA